MDSRFVRQIRFEPIGADGQRRLGEAHALLVGIGALGSHVATWLTRAGVGRLTLVDRDVVDWTNLQRQVLFDEADAEAGVPKALAAAAALRRVHSAAVIEARVAEFDAACLAELEPRPDLIIDGTDNFATRQLINDLAIRDGLPWIYGAAVAAVGRAMVVLPGQTPCLRCLLPDAPAAAELGSCETLGVLVSAVAHVAAFQTTEAIKLLAGRPGDVTRGMLVVDAWRGRFELRLRDAAPLPGCPSCDLRELPALHRTPRPALELCGRGAVQVRPPAGCRVDLTAFAGQLNRAGIAVRTGPGLLRFTADACGVVLFEDGRALLTGVTDLDRAQALYDRWIGASRGQLP